MKSIFILSLIVLLFSCKQKSKESTITRVHHSLSADTTFIFPDEYRKKNYKDDEFENNSMWLNAYDENKLFDKKELKRYIRLAYSRAFDNPIIIIFEREKIIIKETDTAERKYDSHFDSTLLSIEERKWLRSHYYFRWLSSKHKEDSATTINKIISTYPDIADHFKQLYLVNTKGRVYEPDSIVYIERTRYAKKAIIANLFKKLDSLDFWTIRPHVFNKLAADGSGFLLEAKDGNKYNAVNCINCESKTLIQVRNELLRFTNLKKDEIY